MSYFGDKIPYIEEGYNPYVQRCTNITATLNEVLEDNTNYNEVVVLKT